MANRIKMDEQIEQDIRGAAKQYAESFNDEYKHLEAQNRIDATVAAIVAMLEVEPALGHLPVSVIDALCAEIVNTFRWLGAGDACISYVGYAFQNIVEAKQFTIETA